MKKYKRMIIFGVVGFAAPYAVIYYISWGAMITEYGMSFWGMARLLSLLTTPAALFFEEATRR